MPRNRRYTKKQLKYLFSKVFKHGKKKDPYKGMRKGNSTLDPEQIKKDIQKMKENRAKDPIFKAKRKRLEVEEGRLKRAQEAGDERGIRRAKARIKSIKKSLMKYTGSVK